MRIENFAILSGTNTTIKSGVIKFMPELEVLKANVEDNSEVAKADIRADKMFFQGTLKFKFKAKKHETGVMLYSEDNGKPLYNIGLSRSLDSFIIAETTNAISQRAGSFKNYDLNKEIHVKIEWKGSKIKLFINDVILCEANGFPLSFVPIQLRISSSGEVLIYDFELESVRPKIFVVMQFSEEYNKLYEEVIFPVSEKLGYECIRADEYFTSTPILKDIITSIEESSAIIAEITPDNPNVFYEIGYSHAIKKPTILLCDKKREKLPFDVSGLRTLFYENTIAGKSQIEKNLEKYLENIKS